MHAQRFCPAAACVRTVVFKLMQLRPVLTKWMYCKLLVSSNQGYCIWDHALHKEKEEKRKMYSVLV